MGEGELSLVTETAALAASFSQPSIPFPPPLIAMSVDPEELPAWAEPFAADRLARRAGLRRIDRSWAWGGATARESPSPSSTAAWRAATRGSAIGWWRRGVRIDRQGEAEVVPDEPTDLYGHGTACAGIVLDIAPDVDLISVRVLNEDLKGKGAAFVEGLAWAIQRGVQVANLSLSKSEALYPVFHELADEAYFRNVILVSAANNVNVASYPSLFSSVVSVAAHAEPDPWRLYYNPNPPVEFGAWGWMFPSPGRTAPRRSRQGTRSPLPTWRGWPPSSCPSTRA